MESFQVRSMSCSWVRSEYASTGREVSRRRMNAKDTTALDVRSFIVLQVVAADGFLDMPATVSAIV